MKKHVKNPLILGLILCLIFTAALLVACDPKTPDEPKDDNPVEITTYVVTVVGGEAGALDGVTVKLCKADGSVAGEKALEGGKASFELAAEEVYSVELAGLPTGYGYDAAYVSKDAPNCTIKVDKTKSYTVTVNYPDVKNIYGDNVIKAGPVSGVTVSLYAGQLADDRGSALEGKYPAATAVSDNKGTAKFDLIGDKYTIVLANYARGLEIFYPLKSQGILVNTVTSTMPQFDATFTQRYLYGASDTVPIEFKLGENSVPLTMDILTGALEESSSAFYSFTPQKTGNYTFTATGNAKVGGEVFGTNALTSKKSIVVHMEAGVEYLFSCGISSTDGNLAYAVTIEEGGEIDDGGVDSGHTYPWTQGKGTLSAPFTTDSLGGEYTNLYVAAESHFYLAYTPSADETYTFSEIGDNLWLQVYDDIENIPTLSNYLIEVGGDETSKECELKASKTYYILIGTMNDEADTVGFKAEKKGGETPPPSTKATYTVTVVGKDSSGNTQPIAGVSVTIRDADETTKTTDAQGKVTFEAAPTATGYGIRLSNIPANYRDDNDFAFAVSSDKPDLTITLTKIENIRTVSITVKYADGTLAPQGLIVRLIASNNSQTDATTDANGVAHFYVPDDEYQVQIPLFNRVDGEFVDNGPQLDSGQQFHFSKYTVKVQGSDVSLETTYDYTRSVDITVKNADGTIVVGATVEIIDDYEKSYEADTGDDGVARFDRVIEGEFDVLVKYNGKGAQAKLTVKGGNATLSITLSEEA